MQPTQWPSSRNAMLSLATRKPPPAAMADSFVVRRLMRSRRGSFSSFSTMTLPAPAAARAAASKGNTAVRSMMKWRRA